MRRVIFLVDMNAFFISCELTRRPELAGKPAAVAGDPKKRGGIILAANYEARAFGVKTAMVLHEALKLCPDMNLVPPDHDFYGLKSDEVMEILSRFSPVVEQNSIDEAWLDMTGCEALMGPPAESAQNIMNTIKDELGLWCSIGIAENKFLAKMASEMKKPLGITELWQEDIKSKLWPLPVRAMYGIGAQTAQKLYNSRIITIGELANSSGDYLIKNVGRYAAELHMLANGIDNTPVTPHSSDDVKSISRSTTLPQDVSNIEEAKRIMTRLSEEVGLAARNHRKKGRTVQITLKYSDFSQITRQMTIEPTYLTKEICRAGHDLLKKHWNPSRSVRLIGIGLSGFQSEGEPMQLSLFGDESASAETSIKEEKLEKTLDNIKIKHGITKIQRGGF